MCFAVQEQWDVIEKSDCWMTAMDGGEQLDEEPAVLKSVLERRVFEEIFLCGDVDRARLMQETWRSVVASPEKRRPNSWSQPGDSVGGWPICCASRPAAG